MIKQEIIEENGRKMVVTSTDQEKTSLLQVETGEYYGTIVYDAYPCKFTYLEKTWEEIDNEKQI